MIPFSFSNHLSLLDSPLGHRPDRTVPPAFGKFRDGVAAFCALYIYHSTDGDGFKFWFGGGGGDDVPWTYFVGRWFALLAKEGGRRFRIYTLRNVWAFLFTFYSFLYVLLLDLVSLLALILSPYLDDLMNFWGRREEKKSKKDVLLSLLFQRLVVQGVHIYIYVVACMGRLPPVWKACKAKRHDGMDGWWKGARFSPLGFGKRKRKKKKSSYNAAASRQLVVLVWSFPSFLILFLSFDFFFFFTSCDDGWDGMI